MAGTDSTAAYMPLLSATRECAFALMESAERVGAALPGIPVDEPIQLQLASLLPELDAVGKQVFETVTTLQTVQDRPLPVMEQAAVLSGSVEQIAGLVHRLNRIVMTLRSAAERAPECRTAFILVAEAAVNILSPLNRARAVADGIAPVRSS